MHQDAYWKVEKESKTNRKKFLCLHRIRLLFVLTKVNRLKISETPVQNESFLYSLWILWIFLIPLIYEKKYGWISEKCSINGSFCYTLNKTIFFFICSWRYLWINMVDFHSTVLLAGEHISCNVRVSVRLFVYLIVPCSCQGRNMLPNCL